MHILLDLIGIVLLGGLIYLSLLLFLVAMTLFTVVVGSILAMFSIIGEKIFNKKLP